MFRSYGEITAIRTKSANHIIPVVMEPRMVNHSAWKGVLNMEVGGKLHVDYSLDDYLENAANRIIKEMLAITPSLWILKKDISIKNEITNSNANNKKDFPANSFSDMTVTLEADKALLVDMTVWFMEKIKVPNNIATTYSTKLFLMGIGKCFD